MTQLLEFANLCRHVMSTEQLTESSFEMTNRDQKYRNFIQGLHRGGYLLSRQNIGPVTKEEPAWTSIKKRRERYGNDVKVLILWGTNDAILVDVSATAYKIYKYDPETKKISGDAPAISTATEFKKAIKDNIGKVIGYSDFTPGKDLKYQVDQSLSPRDEYKARSMYKRVKPDTSDSSSDLNVKIGNKLRPLMLRMLNRALGNMVDHISNIMKNIPESPKEINTIENKLHRASDIKNYIQFLQGHEVQESNLLTTAINHAILLAAMEKYPDEEYITSGVPTKIQRNLYRTYDPFLATGIGIQKFKKDLEVGSYQDLSRVIRWLGRLL